MRTKTMRITFILWLAALFVAGAALPSMVEAACQGYCADKRPGGCPYNGCTIKRDAQDEICCVQCFYGGYNDKGNVCLTVSESGDCSDTGCGGRAGTLP